MHICLSFFFAIPTIDYCIGQICGHMLVRRFTYFLLFVVVHSDGFSVSNHMCTSYINFLQLPTKDIYTSDAIQM